MTAYRRATKAEIALVLDWAAAEGWNPGLDDADAFYAADPEGFFVAEQAGAPVAAISVVRHSAETAFLGLYLCLPDCRGQGIGYALWQHAMGHAGTRTVGLDGVPAQQENYIRSGFAHAGATTRYAGPVAARAHPAIRLASAGDLASLIDMEARASGWAKPRYMTAWLTGCASRHTLVLERDGDIHGLATVRACRSGAKIGPLIAQGPQDARALLEHAATRFGAEVTIDVPQNATGLDTLCRTLRLASGFHTARMYRGPAPESHAPFYAVGTLELG